MHDGGQRAGQQHFVAFIEGQPAADDEGVIAVTVAGDPRRRVEKQDPAIDTRQTRLGTEPIRLAGQQKAVAGFELHGPRFTPHVQPAPTARHGAEFDPLVAPREIQSPAPAGRQAVRLDGMRAQQGQDVGQRIREL